MLNYTILPAVMGGTVREISADGTVKVGLKGRLGVFFVPMEIIDGPVSVNDRLEFYFSYVWTTETLTEYDPIELRPGSEAAPTVMGGRIIDVNDTAVEAVFMGERARVMVPRRWVFTDVALETARFCEFYFSRMRLRSEILEQEVTL